jgi:hypothetical protein
MADMHNDEDVPYFITGESLQDLKRVPWDPHDLNRMQLVLDRWERPGWLDSLRTRLAWRLLGPHLALSHYGTAPVGTRTPMGWLWWRFKYFLAWVLEPPNAPLSSRLWPTIIHHLDGGGSILARWQDKPQLLVNGEPLEDEELLAEWPLVRHTVAGFDVTQVPEDGEIEGQESTLGGHPATFRFRKSGIEEEITLTVDKTTALKG